MLFHRHITEKDPLSFFSFWLMWRLQSESYRIIYFFKFINLNFFFKSQFQEAPPQLAANRAKQQPQATNQTLTFVDPSINAIVLHLTKELDDTRKRNEGLQAEQDSWKFNPESQMSKRLMAKCRKLLAGSPKRVTKIMEANFVWVDN